MAQYKVPQDVEADDKLIGPFSFRQFVYLLIAAGLIALAVALFQILPILAIIPIPFILLLLALALPIKKDQPMETYLAAVISYYLKPHNRIWTPGQRESTVEITAPKVVDDDDRSRNITGDEVTHRLSFLADIVDTKGRAIDSIGGSRINEDLIMEANTTNDMFETGHFERLESAIAKDENERHKNVVDEMRRAMTNADNLPKVKIRNGVTSHQPPADIFNAEKGKEDQLSSSSYSRQRIQEIKNAAMEKSVENQNRTKSQYSKNEATNLPESSIINLANNTDFSIATIAKEANRMKEKEGEVYISLH